MEQPLPGVQEVILVSPECLFLAVSFLPNGNFNGTNDWPYGHECPNLTGGAGFILKMHT